MEYIIALDLSLSSTGIAIFSDDAKLIEVCSVDTKSETEHQTKLKKIADALMELKIKFNPIKIIIEKGFYRFAGSTEAVFKVHGVAQLVFWDIEQIFYAPTTVKKTVGGAGNMKKEDMRIVVSKMFPNVEWSNNDESDAVSVGMCYFMKDKI